MEGAWLPGSQHTDCNEVPGEGDMEYPGGTPSREYDVYPRPAVHILSLPILATTFTHPLSSHTSQPTWNKGSPLAHDTRSCCFLCGLGPQRSTACSARRATLGGFLTSQYIFSSFIMSYEFSQKETSIQFKHNSTPSPPPSPPPHTHTAIMAHLLWFPVVRLMIYTPLHMQNLPGCGVPAQPLSATAPPPKRGVASPLGFEGLPRLAVGADNCGRHSPALPALPVFPKLAFRRAGLRRLSCLTELSVTGLPTFRSQLWWQSNTILSQLSVILEPRAMRPNTSEGYCFIIWDQGMVQTSAVEGSPGHHDGRALLLKPRHPTRTLNADTHVGLRHSALQVLGDTGPLSSPPLLSQLN